MKYCPTCDTRYDEDILRFCMKDGTPLVDEEEPKFIAMPSKSLEPVEDDPSEVTIVRKSTPIPPPAVEPSFTPPAEPSQRIIVPTVDEPKRAAATAYRPTEPPKSNTLKVVVLTIFGTLFVLTLGALGFWGLQQLSGSNSNTNANINANGNIANENTNVNTNLGMDGNFNFNSLPNSDNDNTNINSNSDSRTPTPTPSPSPRPSPSAVPSVTPDRDDDDDPPPTPLPIPTRPLRTPLPTPTPIIIRPAPQTIRTPNVRRSDDNS